MTSHGVPRGTAEKSLSDSDRKREQKKINDYKGLVEIVTSKIHHEQYNPDTLEITSKLLKWNPEYYTIWNYRRLIIGHLFLNVSSGRDDHVKGHGSAANIISDDLAFLVPLLRKYPKCYWIWKYRLWLLEKAKDTLPSDQAREFWQQELTLVGKMLSLDSRNFLGWSYRRTVITALESEELHVQVTLTSQTQTEFEYTTKMINTNLSNFSAWHNRSKLIPKLLHERNADDAARRKFLDEELELIQRALWAGSEDQSLWFYHQYLISTFDSKSAAKSLAPNLSLEERSQYLLQDLERVQDMLDGAEDCKWIYQSLLQTSIVYKDLNQMWPIESKVVQEWIGQLTNIDPLRAGRWNDLKSKIQF